MLVDQPDETPDGLPRAVNVQVSPPTREDPASLADPLLPIMFCRRVGLGLEFASGTTYEQWESDFKRLLVAERIIPWLVADALAYGEDVWGEDYAQALDTSPYAYQTLANWSYVARRIPRERRRIDVPFTIHQAVAPLDPADQEAMLDRAQEEGLRRDEVRVEVRKLRIAKAQAEADQKPVERIISDMIVIERGDATAMTLNNREIDAIITSPDCTAKTYEEWEDEMEMFLGEARRYLVERGRLIVTLPLDGTFEKKIQPIASRFCSLATLLGFTYQSTLCWRDTTRNIGPKRGSLDSPSGVRVITPINQILVFSWGEWVRPMTQGRRPDISHEEWVDWTDGDWRFPGEDDPWEGWADADPIELPRRLLKLFTYEGDRICDPYAGTGTTAMACWQLLRQCWSFDKDISRVESAARRLNALVGRSAYLRQ
jgi:site-specific DNA-methyltransferase (adenine-specific)